MVDETDISREKAYYYKQRASRVIDNLQRRKMNGLFCEDRKDALDAVMGMIPPGVMVARGDSISLDQIGFPAEIARRGENAVIDPFVTSDKGFWPEEAERQKMMRETFFADVFVTGTNAVTMDGRLVNIDGHGNRVSAMIFGPAKVILVVGANKIVEDLDAALERVRQYAAPLNARRHVEKHHSEGLASLPCVKSGVCADCRSDWRICNYTVIIDGAMPAHQGRINVVLVGEELGL
ncbi:MAG: lactate utilization protein [Dehalococcoidales bacterium]|nr:lactate utilization protein [Dehalococcoidales bacterium]